MKNRIEIKEVGKAFCRPLEQNRKKAETLEVLSHVNFDVGENEFVSLLGPSGCGKSTLLKLIAGLDDNYCGVILIGGKNPKCERVPVCYMLQKDCLMPWRNMISNILLPIEIKKGDLKEAREDIKPLVKEFGLEGFEQYKPHQLSGGMRQRAALLRTYLMEGDIMLLDEPFGALDELTRMQMQNWLVEVWERHRKTVLFVTHDIDEAVLLSDRVLVMGPRPGTITADIRIQFERPRSRDVLLDNELLNYKRMIMEAITKH